MYYYISAPRTAAKLSTEPAVDTQTKKSLKKGQASAPKDWIAELIHERHEEYAQDASVFAHRIDQGKMIQIRTDGGARPNPGKSWMGCAVQAGPAIHGYLEALSARNEQRDGTCGSHCSALVHATGDGCMDLV